MSDSPKNRNDVVWPRFCGLVKQTNLWVGDLPLYDWQIDVLNAAQVPHSRALISTANESGKSSVVAPIFLFGIAAAFKGASCHATSGNEEQLHDQLFAILKEKALEHGWDVKETGMLITLPNGSTIKCSVKGDPRSAEGFHGKWDPRDGGYYRPCAYFIDEAKHVQNDTHNAVRRIDPDFMLACSTPPTEHNAKYDWFWDGIDYDHLERIVESRRRELNLPKPKGVYTKKLWELEDQDPIHSFPGEYFTYRRIVPWTECPHLQTPAKKLERENIRIEMGENSSFYRSMMLGLATDGDVKNPIFNAEEVDKMRTQAMVPGNSKPQLGDMRVAADVSGTGLSDPMVLGVRKGSTVVYFKEHKGMDDIAQAEFLVSWCRQLKVSAHQCCVDGMGIGASVVNRMEQTCGFHGVNRFLANNAPTYQEQFADRYTELHWVIKDLLSYNVLSMIWYPDLLRDMRERQYVMMPTGKIKTEPKKEHRKRTGHSPDALDTLIYLFEDFPIMLVRRGKETQTTLRKPIEPERPWDSGHKTDKNQTQKILSEIIAQPSLAQIMAENINTQPR